MFIVPETCYAEWFICEANLERVDLRSLDFVSRGINTFLMTEESEFKSLVF